MGVCAGVPRDGGMPQEKAGKKPPGSCSDLAWPRVGAGLSTRQSLGSAWLTQQARPGWRRGSGPTPGRYTIIPMGPGPPQSTAGSGDPGGLGLH